MEAVEHLAGQIKLENYQTFSLFMVHKVRQQCGVSRQAVVVGLGVQCAWPLLNCSGPPKPVAVHPSQGKPGDEVGVPPTDEHVLCDDNRFIADIMWVATGCEGL